jgi:precorrin-6B methylase 2
MGHLWTRFLERSPLFRACFRFIRRISNGAIALSLLLSLGLGLTACQAPPGEISLGRGTKAPALIYTYRDRPSANGIGKQYQGREIAKVMGHREALWLERPGRERSEQPEMAIAALDLQPTDIVADIGAGTGYFSFRIAPLVPEGQVFAVDIQPEMIDILEFLKQEDQVENVTPILGSIDSPNLPTSSVDLVLMVDAYHEFEFPYEMMQGVVEALKPGGRVALIEYRQENPWVPIKGLHKMTQRQVRREMQAVSLEWQSTFDGLPQQHLLLFRKPERN